MKKPEAKAKWLSFAECRSEYGLSRMQLVTLRKPREGGARVRAVKATPKKWLYCRADLDRIFAPPALSEEDAADLAWIEERIAKEA